MCHCLDVVVVAAAVGTKSQPVPLEYDDVCVVSLCEREENAVVVVVAECFEADAHERKMKVRVLGKEQQGWFERSLLAQMQKMFPRENDDS